MTVSSTTRRNDYVGNGATATYAYNFRIFDESELLVTIRDTSNVEVTQVLSTDYTVTGVGEADGGNIVLVAGNLTSGYALTIRRKLSLLQGTDLRNQGAYFAEDVEDVFDKLVMMTLQQQDEVDRSIKLPETVAAAGVSTSLPVPEANKILLWNATADAIISKSAADAGSVLLTAFVETLVDDATAAEFMTTLGMTTLGQGIVTAANEAAFKALVNLEIGTDVQAWSTILDGMQQSFLTAHKTKLDFIAITQAVDLDALETAVANLDAAVVLQGTWDASAGTFPGGGTAQAGASWIVSVAGTVDSVTFNINDRIIAITDNASTTTFAANWFKSDYTDQVLSVNSQTGAVVLDADDISDAATTNKFTTAAEITKLAGIETAATADQTGAEIKTAYEAEANTNAFTDALLSKLNGIEAGAEVNDIIGVDVHGYNADYSGKLVAPTEAFTNLGTKSVATNIDMSTSQNQAITLGASITLTMTNPPTTGILGFVQLEITYNGAFTPTFAGGTIKNPHTVAPDWASASGKTDVVTIWTRDGGTTYVVSLGQPNIG